MILIILWDVDIYSDEPILLNREDLNEITTEEPPMTELFEEIVYPSPQSGLIDVPSDQISRNFILFCDFYLNFCYRVTTTSL